MTADSARTRSPFGQFQLNRSGIDVGTDYTKVHQRASANDMALMLRDGVSVLEVAQAHGIAASTLRSRLTDAGYSSTGQQVRKYHVPVAAQTPLAPALFADQPWADEALCAQTDPEAFFPEKGGSTKDAKKVCAGCNVAAECLSYALDHDERFGIWGGLSERERRKIRQNATCPLCERELTTTANRDRHIILRHNPDNPHACTVCGQTFRYPANLDRHTQGDSFDNPRHQTNTERDTAS